MNPRHRRLVLPALLVALVLVVVVAALTRDAQAATDPPLAPAQAVCTLTDPRISESSGLAVSRTHPGLLYTVNDSGHAAVVYVVDAATCQSVGTTIVAANWRDTEALGVDGAGNLWVADIGDNQTDRDDVSLWKLPEPGPGTHLTQATEYPIEYDGGSFDAETLLIDPTSDAKWIVTKRADGGQIFPLIGITPDEVTEVEPLEERVAPFLTDGSATPDGKFAVLRSGTQAFVHELDSWTPRGVVQLPPQHQGEGLTVEASGASYLIDSEGAFSPILRVGLTIEPAAAVTVKKRHTAKAPWPGLPWVAGGVMALIAAAGIGVISRRSVR